MIEEPVGITEDADKDQIKEALREKCAFIRFKKKDGTERRMFGTTNLGLIKESDHPNPDTARKVNEDVCVIYDLEAGGWRSFRWDSVYEWQAREIPEDFEL